MIRHLPIINAPSDLKKEISKLVQGVINSLLKSKGVYKKEILFKIKEIEELIFDLYDLESNERKMIVSDIGNRISLYKKVYD